MRILIFLSFLKRRKGLLSSFCWVLVGWPSIMLVLETYLLNGLSPELLSR